MISNFYIFFSSCHVSSYIFLSLVLTLSLLPLRVQAALPKELTTAPAKFLTGACLTRSEDLWITAEAGGICRLSGQENETEVGGHAEAAGIPENGQLHGGLRGFAGAYLGRDLEHGSAGIPQGAMEAL